MNLEDRIKHRLVMETGDEDLHEREIGKPLESDGIWTSVDLAARIAALEAEDTANPIVATAVVRPALALVLDEVAVIAKFAQEENRG